MSSMLNLGTSTRWTSSSPTPEGWSSQTTGWSVVRWFPRQMYDRYRAVESVAYEIRKNLKQKTRVKIGRGDIELSIRETGSNFWRKQVLPDDLPAIDLDNTYRPADIPSSPPPGRPGRHLMFERSNVGSSSMEKTELGLGDIAVIEENKTQA